MSVKVVVINGYPGSGKDEFIKCCAQGRFKDIIKIHNISSVDRVKNALMCLGWDGKEKTPQIRDTLSDLKDLSTKLFDGPATYIKETVEDIKEDTSGVIDHSKHNFVFVHAREPEELQRYKEELGATIIFIARDVVVDSKNHSDNYVEQFNYDWIIDNNGTLERLTESADTFISNLIEEDKN
jgi:hypothetical protein